jgi:hypothetical protein
LRLRSQPIKNLKLTPRPVRRMASYSAAALLAAVVVVAVAVAVVVATAAAVALLLNNPLLIFIMQGRRKPSLFFIFTRQIFPASLRSGNVQRRLNCNLSPGRTSHQTLRASLIIIECRDEVAANQKLNL